MPVCACAVFLCLIEVTQKKKKKKRIKETLPTPPTPTPSNDCPFHFPWTQGQTVRHTYPLQGSVSGSRKDTIPVPSSSGEMT